MAGMSFANAFLGICHSMAHKLGGEFDLPHGVANALLLDKVVRFNAVDTPVKMGTFPQYTHPFASEKYAAVADALGLGGNSKQEKIDKLVKAIEDLKAAIEIKPNIKDYDICEDDFKTALDEMSENAFDDQCTGSNPRYPLISEIKEIYMQAYHG